MSTDKTYIGLSFGNHNSVIAIINNDNRAEVIANEDGEHKTPTFIAFSGEEEYHGSQAKHQVVRNAKNTIMGFRDLLGKSFSEEMNSEHPEFAKIINKDGKPVFSISVTTDEGDSKAIELTPNEVTTRYLGRLKTTAEEYLGRKIDGAVIALPVSFTDAQRKSVADACAAADLPILQMISEPAAVAFRYGLGESATYNDPKDTLALVVDVGGSSSDVALVAVTGGLYTVVANKHTNDLSGDGLDDVLVKHFAAEFKRNTQIDIIGDNNLKALRKLKQACEVTKRTLSASTTAPCAVESLADGVDFSSTINRTRFDILASKAYNPLIDSISSMIKDAGYSTSQVSKVLFAGGAARIRKLQSKVSMIFPESTEMLSDADELDEIIAAGCAEQATLISEGKVAESVGVSKDVGMLAKAIGLRLSEEKLVPVLFRDSPLPVSRSIKVSLPKGEKRAYLAVSEGEPVPPKDEDEDEDEDEDADEEKQAVYRPSKLLAEMVLELDQVDENTRVEVKFFVDVNGNLTVAATEPVSGKSITAEIPV